MSEHTLASRLDDAELLGRASPRPWYFDGRDILTASHPDDGHRLVVPLPDTWHESQRVSPYDAELIVRAVNAFEQRDK